MKKVFITGGSGTVGEAFIKEYYNEYEFYSYSRNEEKINRLIQQYPKVKNIIGDITNLEHLIVTLDNIRPDIIIHSAAMKHINLAEENPTEAIKSNVIGSLNIITAAIKSKVSLTVGISTDKACNPQSVYGYTKKLMEQMFMDNHSEQIRFICTRFANVAGSNGSVIPFWKEQVAKKQNLKLTDKDMNRLMFSKRDAAMLIKKAIDISDSDIKNTFVISKKLKSINLLELANHMSELPVEITGKRPGEKLDETLIHEKELPYTEILDDYVLIRNTIVDKSLNIETEYSSLTAEKACIEYINELINQD